MNTFSLDDDMTNVTFSTLNTEIPADTMTDVPYYTTNTEIPTTATMWSPYQNINTTTPYDAMTDVHCYDINSSITYNATTWDPYDGNEWDMFPQGGDILYQQQASIQGDVEITMQPDGYQMAVMEQEMNDYFSTELSLPTVSPGAISDGMPRMCSSTQPLPHGPPSKQKKPRKTRSDKGKLRGKRNTTYLTTSSILPATVANTRSCKRINSGSGPSTPITQHTARPQPDESPPAKKQRKTRTDSKLWPKASDERLGGDLFLSEPVTPATFMASVKGSGKL